NVAPFIIAIAAVVMYILPFGSFIRKYRRGTVSFPSDLVRRRLVNMPLVVSALGMTGWLAAFLSISILSVLARHDSFSYIIPFLLMNFASFATNAVACFVISYYLLDSLARRKYIPLFFPDGKISQVKGAIHLSVGARFLILVSAITFFPMFVLALALNVVSADPSKLPTALAFIAFFIPVTILLLMLISRAFHEPLVNMKKVTDDIGNDNLDGTVKVLTGDELGSLGDAINLMVSSLREKEYIKDTFGRIVDPRVRDFLLKGNARLGGSVCKGVVLFSDIRGFTSLSESASPDRVVAQLNRYFERMSSIVVDHGGYVNKFIGDAILALFGFPIEIEERSDGALLAANEMLRSLDTLNDDFVRDGYSPLSIGVALHEGELLTGNIGSSSRMEFTVIGDSVNLASRIEGLTKRFGTPLLVSGAFARSLSQRENFRLRFIGNAHVRGRKEYVDLYESIDAFPEHIADNRHAQAETFSRALGLYCTGRIADALREFQELLRNDPDDGVSLYYHQRAQSMLAVTLPDDWDGTE
ncbi:MAG TPA: adenylate/guanylate cyclase domain-containing protein, partial [Spirochaetota bacterium]